MAVSPKALSSPPKSNGNLGALLASASSIHRQPKQKLPTNLLSNNQEQSRSSTDQQKPNSAFLSISKSTDKNSSPAAAELLIKLISGSLSNGTTPIEAKPTTSLSTSTLMGLPSTTETKLKTNEPDHVELRRLETWQDEDEQPMDCYQELLELSSSNGWSADEMFKYNERMHNITEYSYKEENYTTRKPNITGKTLRVVNKIAKEIEERANAVGRVTPESSDDDEIYENLKLQKAHMKQQSQLDQLRSLQQQHRFTTGAGTNGVMPQVVNNSVGGVNKTTKSSSQYSNSTETPATVSLSSSPTLNDIMIKPVTSSSRNILRTCLT